LGFTDLLTHTQLNDEQKDYVNTIKESGANLLAIINDILDFSKIEAGKLVIDSVAFDLRDCVEEVLSLLAPAAYGKNLELVHLIYSDVPVKLYGDPIRIRQVLTNLAHNAIKFTPAGRVIVRVMLDEDNEKDVLLRITVADTGIGLCEADQKKLFNAFSQADTSTTRRFGGAGLGLVISKKLVEQMGGTVGLESEPEKGSTFWFTLRLIKQKVSDSDKKITPLHGRRLLLFDEQPLSRLALRHLFEAWEIAVSDVDNRQSFVSMLSAPDSWDMAVMGISRSDLASSSLNQTMQRIRRFEVPLIALANTVDRNELRSLFQYGAQVALPKSTRRQTLYREICRLLDSPKEASQFYPEETSTPVAVKSVHHGREDDKQIRIMVVDDNRINRKLATTLSIKQGASVVEAENGQEAVSHAMKGQFDVILMDIHMPLMNGEEAAVKMREIYDGKQQPIIIALTANAMPGEKERLLASGMDECLIKPITEDQLSTILKKFVADSKKEEENMVLNQHPVSVSDPAPLLASSKPETASVGKKSLTDELLSMLIAELPVHQKQIHEHWEAGNMQALQDSVHKLNGAASVCNVPPLKEAADELESYLRNRNMKKIPESYELLMAEIEALHVQKTDG
jgi:two-component system sensor histidine kinase BarA